MDKLSAYRQIIKDILCSYSNGLNKQPRPGKDLVVIIDDEHGQYLLMYVGWDGWRRILNIIVYVRLVNGKVYIEEDWLEEGIATDLLEAGVPNEDIVLAFHHPDMRPFTEFAVA